MQQTSIHAHPLLTQYIIGLGAPERIHTLCVCVCVFRFENKTDKN